MLLAAALAHWELERTYGLIERLDPIADPRRRLAEWGRHALAADKALLVALHDAGEHPVVAPVLGRVTERRIRWLADVLRAVGVSPSAARRRARLLYAADLGLFQVGRAVPGERPTDCQLDGLIREIQDAFLP